MTEFLNRCRVCGRTPEQIKNELGVEEVILIGGMCVICYKKQNVDLKEIETYLEDVKSKAKEVRK